jgi:hypothetical protein
MSVIFINRDPLRSLIIIAEMERELLSHAALQHANATILAQCHKLFHENMASTVACVNDQASSEKFVYAAVNTWNQTLTHGRNNTTAVHGSITHDLDALGLSSYIETYLQAKAPQVRVSVLRNLIHLLASTCPMDDYMLAVKWLYSTPDAPVLLKQILAVYAAHKKPSWLLKPEAKKYLPLLFIGEFSEKVWVAECNKAYSQVLWKKPS